MKKAYKKLLGVMLVVILCASQLGLVASGEGMRRSPLEERGVHQRYVTFGEAYGERTPEEIWAEEQGNIRAEWFNTIPESNKVENWPQGPLTYAHSAIVMEINSGAVLYSKNSDAVMYPASITKLLTLLVALNYSELTDPVEFTEASMAMVRWDYAHIAMREGEVISMEDALFALMLASANEVAVAIAETVGDLMDGGGMDSFIRVMNETSREIGTTQSNWSNPTGLHGCDHYTTAYDMALITSVLYHYPQYHRIMGELGHEIDETNLVEEVRHVWQDHQMLLNPVNDFFNPFANGGKTGFTNEAGTTLVTTGNNGEFSIVVVLLYAYGWEAYITTEALFDYAFNHFSKFYLEENLLDQHVIEFLEENRYIMLPNSIAFSEVEREIIVTDENNNLGIARYTYRGQFLGEVRIALSDDYFDYLAYLEELAYLEALAALEALQEAEREEASGEIGGEDPEEQGSSRTNIIVIVLAVVVVILVISFALVVQQIRLKRMIAERRRKERDRRERELNHY